MHVGDRRAAHPAVSIIAARICRIDVDLWIDLQVFQIDHLGYHELNVSIVSINA